MLILSIFFLVVNVDTAIITAEPYIFQIFLFQLLCSNFLVFCNGRDYFWPLMLWRLFKAKNPIIMSSHLGTLTQHRVHSTEPQQWDPGSWLLVLYNLAKKLKKWQQFSWNFFIIKIKLGNVKSNWAQPTQDTRSKKFLIATTKSLSAGKVLSRFAV